MNYTLSKLDTPLMILTALLATLGLITLYSASGGNSHLILKQIMHLTIGCLIMLGVTQIKYADIKDSSPWLYLIGNSLLLAVLMLGFISKGAQRWLGFGSIHIQPSELMKIFLPLCLCWFFDHKESPPKITTLIISAAIIAVPFFMVYKQPDLGTAMILLIISSIAVFIAGIARKLIIAISILATCMAPILWQHMHSYQKQRILTFLNPESDPLGAGYHIMQSKIAVGSGGLFGKGFMLGSQAQLNFLPEHTTDFIFAVIAEEAGFMGCLAIIILIMLITLRIFYLGHKNPNKFCRNACICFGSMFCLSAIINMAMVVGLLPIVGIPLPLVSYGGSNMLVTCTSLGIVMSLKNHWKTSHANN